MEHELEWLYSAKHNTICITQFAIPMLKVVSLYCSAQLWMALKVNKMQRTGTVYIDSNVGWLSGVSEDLRCRGLNILNLSEFRKEHWIVVKLRIGKSKNQCICTFTVAYWGALAVFWMCTKVILASEVIRESNDEHYGQFHYYLYI